MAADWPTMGSKNENASLFCKGVYSLLTTPSTGFDF
jgi:hypothetical protein